MYDEQYMRKQAKKIIVHRLCEIFITHKSQMERWALTKNFTSIDISDMEAEFEALSKEAARVIERLKFEIQEMEADAI